MFMKEIVNGSAHFFHFQLHFNFLPVRSAVPYSELSVCISFLAALLAAVGKIIVFFVLSLAFVHCFIHLYLKCF
jgi:hypothetical protein